MGVANNYLLIDGHGTKEPKAYAQNKAIYGLAVDPQNEYQIASFAKVPTDRVRYVLVFISSIHLS